MKRRDLFKVLAVPAVTGVPTLLVALPSVDPLALPKHPSGERELVFRPIPAGLLQETVERMVLTPKWPWLT